MPPIWLRAKSELRSRWAASVVLVLLLALVGSVTLAAAIGARRTATASQRLLAAVDGRVDVQILNVGEADLASIEGLPMVERSSVARFLVSDAEMDLTTTTDQLFAAQLVDGAVDPTDPLAAAVDGQTAAALDLAVGDQVDLALYSAAQFEAQDPTGGPQGPHPTVRIAAILREPDDVDSADPRAVESLGSDDSLALPQVFLERYGDEIGLFSNVFLSVQLRGGQEAVADFKAAVRRLPRTGSIQFLNSDAPRARTTDRAIRLQASALGLLAVAVLVAGALTVGQILVRHLRTEAADAETLRALGMTRPQLARVGLLRGAVIGSASALLAVAGAIAWSPLTPVGIARAAEPHRGVEVSVGPLVAGAVAIALLVIVTATVVAHRGARDPEGRRARPVTAARRGESMTAAARGRSGPTLATALSLAFGSRASRLATRSTIGALATAVVVLAAGAVLVASLDHVVDRPSRYGWTFDAVAGNPFEEDPLDLFAFVEQTPGIEAVAGAANVALEIDGQPVTVLAVESGTGIEIDPVDGAAPAGLGEIALGRRTLGALDVAIGDRVSLDAGAGPVPVTVTGTVVVPEIGGTGNGLGDGGVLTLAALGEVAPETQPNLALLRFRPGGHDQAVGTFATLSDDTQPLVETFLPASLYQFVRIRSLPAVVAALAVLLAVATLVQNLVGVGWARRRDLAVLKALGFTRGQVAGSSLWQATCFAVVALAVGLPLGVAAGRLAWAAIGRGLGLAHGPAVPVALLAGLVPAGLLAVNLVATVPGWLAARRTPSAVLRRE